MAFLTVSVNRTGNSIVVTGTANAAVTVTIQGHAMQVVNPLGGMYTAVFPSRNGSVLVNASCPPKDITAVLDGDISGLGNFFRLTNLVEIKASRTSEDTIKMSGKFAGAQNLPTQVRCRRVGGAVGFFLPLEEMQVGLDQNNEWSVTFQNCAGGGHKFEVEPG